MSAITVEIVFSDLLEQSLDVFVKAAINRRGGTAPFKEVYKVAGKRIVEN